MFVLSVVTSIFTAVLARNRPAPLFRRKFLRKMLLISVLTGLFSALGGGIYWWSEHKYEYIPKRWGVVAPGVIYRSGQLTPEMFGKTLKKHGIATVIDLQLNDVRDPIQQAEVQYAAEHGLKLLRFPLAGDGTGEMSSYVDALSTLIQCERAGEPILIHCAAGTQRTGGVVACYRLLVDEAEPSEVYAEMQDYEWDPEDRELVEYINTHLPQIARQLVDRGLLDRVPSPMPRLGE